jgi:hypothetical protein
MPRIEFTLSMPNRSSWDGRWSGEDRHYAIVRDLDNDKAESLAGKSFYYAWPDGWGASIAARRVADGEELRKSDGFNGYDWMIASILRYGKIYADHERPKP